MATKGQHVLGTTWVLMKLVDEVTEGAFADDDSELEIFFSEADSDSSEGVSSEDSSAEEIGTYNIHSGTSITQATRGRSL